MQEFLDWLWEATGLVFMAVCCGGACVAYAPRDSASFAELLDYVPGRVECIVAVVCGNDLCVGNRVRALSPGDRVDWAIQALCRGMRTKSRQQFAVVGGSSEL